jgi:GAF domain-containing protein
MNIFQRINPSNPPESLVNADVFILLREKILQYGLIGASVIATILAPMVVIRDIGTGDWFRVVVFSFAYIIVLAITYLRNTSFFIRSNLFSGLFFLIGLVDLLGAGMSGEGRLFLLAFVIMRTLLSTDNHILSGLISGFSALVTLMLIGWGMSTGWIEQPPVETLTNSYRFSEWLNGNLVFLMLSAAVISSLNLLIRRTQIALKQQVKFTEDIEIAQTKIQTEFNKQQELVNRRATELETASALARNISRFTNLDNLLANAVNLIRDQFGFYHAGLFLLDENQEFAVLRSATGDAGRQMLANNHRLRVGEVGLVGYAVSKGEPRIAQDVYQDNLHYKNPILPDTRSEIALPLQVAGNMIGALDVQSTRELAFQPDDVKMLEMIADQLAIAINKAQILQQLQQSVENLEARYLHTATSSWNQFLTSENQAFSLSLSKTSQELNESASITEKDKQAISEKKTVRYTKDSGGKNKSTELSVPLMLRDNLVLGALRVEFEGENIPKQTVEMLENISNRLALALDRAKLMNEIQSTAEQDRLITDVSAKIRSSSNIDNILKTAASEIGRSLGASEVIVQLLPTNDN